MFHFLRELFRVLLNPQGYQEQKQAELHTERQRILAEAAKIDIVAKPKAERRRFQQLAQALDFIANCLENDDISGLASEAAYSEAFYQPPGQPYYFKLNFDSLKERHQRKDLRDMYTHLEFPENKTHFVLGGPFSELEHMQIHFVKDEGGWLFADIAALR